MIPRNRILRFLASVLFVHTATAKNNMLFFSENNPKPPGKGKRFIVSHKAETGQSGRYGSLQIKGDCKKVGGTVIQVMDELGLTVVEFANHTAATTFASFGHSSIMEEDKPRYLMRIKGGSKPVDKSQQGGHVDAVTRNLQRYSQVIPYGVYKVFQNTLPDSSYYPSKNVTIPICIVDSGYNGTTHPDLSNVEVTAADPNQQSDFSDQCWDSHGTHIAGTVVAEDNDLGVIGIFPGASIKVVRVLGGGSCGWTYSSDLVAAASSCVASGAKILSLSFGGSDPSSYEKLFFQSLRARGILVFAASGNDSGYKYNYPASYESVVSVAAIDQSNQLTFFSQWNEFVDIAAPGFAVLSTVNEPSFYYAVANGVTFPMSILEFSPAPSADIHAKTCQCNTTTCPDTCTGRLCVIPRGDLTYGEKANECAANGGIAAIIYHNQPGFFRGGLKSVFETNIPVFGTSDSYGAQIVSVGTDVDFFLGATADPYDFRSGSSMSTPHASGVAFLLWNKFPWCTSEQILSAILATAFDLGPPGRDDYFGYGLIQYWSAAEYLSNKCGGSPPISPSPSPVPTIAPQAAPNVANAFTEAPVSLALAAPDVTDLLTPAPS